MFRHSHPREPYFQGVALAAIILGASVFAIGGIEWIGNTFGGIGFNAPWNKIIGGAVITILGYIHLELELMRVHGGTGKREL